MKERTEIGASLVGARRQREKCLKYSTILRVQFGLQAKVIKRVRLPIFLASMYRPRPKGKKYERFFASLSFPFLMRFSAKLSCAWVTTWPTNWPTKAPLSSCVVVFRISPWRYASSVVRCERKSFSKVQKEQLKIVGLAFGLCVNVYLTTYQGWLFKFSC